MILKVKKVDPKARLPESMTPGSVALDLSVLERVELNEGEKHKYSTGLAIELPPGYAGILVPRSSTGAAGLTLANTLGVIDNDYRGEIEIVVHARGYINIPAGMRMAQLLVVPYLTCKVKEVEHLTTTKRGSGGFGSTK